MTTAHIPLIQRIKTEDGKEWIFISIHQGPVSVNLTYSLEETQAFARALHLHSGGVLEEYAHAVQEREGGTV